MKRTTSIRAAGIIATAILVMACGNRGGGDATTQPSVDGGQTGESAAGAPRRADRHARRLDPAAG